MIFHFRLFRIILVIQIERDGLPCFTYTDLVSALLLLQLYMYAFVALCSRTFGRERIRAIMPPLTPGQPIRAVMAG